MVDCVIECAVESYA